MPKLLVALGERFWGRTRIGDSVYDGSPCIEWTGVKNHNGYGRFSADDRRVLSHRWAYEWANGPGSIPAGLQIDHLCRNRSCVAPAHLQPVTARENTLRGETVAALNAAKTHCPQGHPYTPENTYRVPPNKRTPNGGRECRECQRARNRQCYAKKKAAARRAGSGSAGAL